MLIPKKKHALIKFCRLVLKTDEPITEKHVNSVRDKMIEFLESGKTPEDIKNLYKIQYTDFGMFLKTTLKIELKSRKDATLNFYRNTGRAKTSEKELYKSKCQFKFDPYSLSTIPGFNLLMEVGLYHPTKNPNGVCRDHMLSIEFGWRNKVPWEKLSHPANCQFITNIENISKGSGCILSLDQLNERIRLSDFSEIRTKTNRLSLSKEHKDKIRKSIAKLISVTNGTENRKIERGSKIPDGFWRGMTRNGGRSARIRTGKRDILSISGIPIPFTDP